ncbi:hypothetical protein ABIA35_009085 [Catenulispora sp. MAP12-49]|uniref:hypothetical protein n=1 Tax=Catenulispora sp. MAP12-49 TaxID=3156302 RepID=UPI003513DF3D
MTQRHGLFVPAVASPATAQPSGSGLIVPDGSWAAPLLGLVPVPADSEWPEDLMKVYLTARDYLDPAAAAIGIPTEAAATWNPQQWRVAIVRQHQREELICVLAALNHAMFNDEHMKHHFEKFLSRISPQMAAFVSAAMDGTFDGQPRSFLSRQGVLRALRDVLVTNHTQAPATDDIDTVVRHIDVETAAVVLVHLAAGEMGRERDSDQERFAGMPATLAMEMVANNYFNAVGDPGSALARTWSLWNDYGTRVTGIPMRKSPPEMLEEAAGIGFGDLTALGFAYYAHAISRKPDGPVRVNAFTNIPIDRATIETFLSRFAWTLDGLGDQLSGCTRSWQMLPIQDRPMVRIGNDVVVLDEQYLVERITRGLYWLVHDHEKAVHGDTERVRWTQIYGQMIERRVEDQIRRLAPALIGGGDTFFTEETLQDAFPGTRNVDTGIDFGRVVVLAEVVSAEASVPTREGGDIAAFKRDVERIFIKKARQLDVSAKNLARDPQPLNSPLTAPARRVVPVAVRGGQFPINPVTRRYVKECLAAENLLQDTRTIADFALIDLEDLENCEALSEKRGATFPDVLEGWASSRYRDTSLRSYLIQALDIGQLGRPTHLQDELDQAFTGLGNRLRALWHRPHDLTATDE